jgi:hypothetical protein
VHTPARQAEAVGSVQSLFCRHATQRPPRLHSLPVCVAQSVFDRHSTQLDVVTLQSGVDVLAHPALEVHPGRQEKSCGSQMGAAVPQSALLTHATHCPVPRKQRGRPAGQSDAFAHSTHCRVVGSQIGAPAPQSEDVLQPTHSPVPLLVSHRGAPRGHAVGPVQAVWHWWSPGQHEGVAAGQSVSRWHWPHCPSATQTGAEAGQLALLRQSTHPRVALHCWLVSHCTVPFTPHSALPAGRPDELLPPQATSTTRMALARAPSEPMIRRMG